MISIIFLLFAYLSEALIVYSYTSYIYKPAKKHFHSLFLVIALYMCLLIIHELIIDAEIINALLIIVVNFCITFFIFKGNIKSAFFHTIVLCILQYVSEAVSLYIIALVFDVSSIQVVDLYFETGTILSRILYFMTCKFLERIAYKETNSKSWGHWYALSILPVSSIIVILSVRKLTNQINLTTDTSISCITALFVLLVANIAVYTIYEQAEISNQKLIDLEILNQKSSINMQYLNLLEKKNEQMQIMAHDYKNNVLTIADMTDSIEIKEYINSMVGEIKKYNQIAGTKNRLLDVILNKYTDICDNKNLTFETDIMTDNLSFIDGYDISSLFNNILDNAVEAAEKSKDRFISLSISTSLNSYHKITVINSCDTKPKTKNGKLLTDKTDKSAHGLGTKSINKIVSKYDGELQWDYNVKEKTFKLTIIMPLE